MKIPFRIAGLQAQMSKLWPLNVRRVT